MDATVAPSPWPAPASRPRAAAWRFGREADAGALQWKLVRNCSVSPGQLLGSYLVLCVVSLSIGAAFALHGAGYVLGFAGLELLLVGIALLVHARHVGDGETLTLVGRSLQVERHAGGSTECADFAVQWLTVEPVAGQNSLIRLAGQGRVLHVGRWLRADLRADFARELRLALRQAR
jgi:uncharacterized membrane protein